jgi:glycosyltransferase involved in cell wall biosynthesis
MTKIFINALHAKTGGGLTYLRALLPRLAACREAEIHLGLHKDQLDLFSPLDPRIRLQLFDFKDGFVRRLIWEQLVLPWHAWKLAAVTFSPANFGPLLAPRPVVLLRNALDVSAQDRRLGKKLYWQALGLMTWLSLWAAPRALAVSSYARDRLAFGFKEKTAIVHHGVETLRFHPDGKARERFLLAVGDLTVQKNFHTLIEAMTALPGLELRIAGRRVDEDYAQRLEERIRDLGLEKRVVLLGPQPTEALAGLYRQCAFFVFSSTVETFGNPLLEAMASGCPILCARAAAMPEILGEAGLYFDPGLVDDLTAQIRRLLENEALRQDLGQRALQRSKAFSWDQTARQTLGHLEAAGKGRAMALLPLLLWAWVAGILAAYLIQFRPLLLPILARLGLA